MTNDTSQKKAILLDLTDKELAQAVADNLRPLFKEQIREVIDEFYQDQEEPISMEQACDWLGIGRTTFSKIINSGEIPYKSLNPDSPTAKKIILKRDLVEWIEKNKTKSIEQIKESYNGKA